MSIAAFNFIAGKMQEVGVPYVFGRWEAEPETDYYCVGESYIETPSANKVENNKTDTTLYLRLYTRQDWLTLEQAKELIERTFNTTAILENGSGVAIFCDGVVITPTGDNTLKAMKIDLNIQEWSVN